MPTKNTTQFHEALDLAEFDNLEPIRIGEPIGFEELIGFTGDNTQGNLHKFQSFDELGEVARAAGQRFKACFATK